MICPSEKPVSVVTAVYVLFNIKPIIKRIFLVVTAVTTAEDVRNALTVLDVRQWTNHFPKA